VAERGDVGYELRRTLLLGVSVNKPSANAPGFSAWHPAAAQIRGVGSPGKWIGKEDEGMVKVVYVMFKKEGMSREEFRSYWRDTHAPIAKEMSGLKEYVQNHALVDAEGNEPPYDGFDELYFESQEAMEETLATREGQATLNDLPNFCDMGKTLGIAVEEVKIV
jgi:uncharacterized protein (TIGR02118 family)